MRRSPATAALALQLLAALTGAAIFQLAGIPAAWLSGAVVGTVLFAATGLGRALPPALADAAMLVAGASMGAAVTPEAVAAVGRYPLSLLVLALAVVGISAGSMLWLVRISRWRAEDALLASVPGALSAVMAVAADRGADVASISVVQTVRLFILITFLPVILVAVGGGNAAALPGTGLAVASPLSLLAVLAAGLAVGLVFRRLKVAAPILLGATAASAVLHGTAMAPGAMPPEVAAGGLVLLGVFIAERFRTLDLRALQRLLPAALGSFAIGMILAAAGAWLAARLAGVGLAQALLAFAPGGLEAMTVLSLALGIDPLYVGVHHLARFLGIGFALPFIAGWLGRRP